MVFVESTLFTKHLKNYLNDEEYTAFQSYLVENPEAGDFIQGSGGLRKIRWGLATKGKRGGIRVIYYWQVREDQIYLLTIYGKNEMANLSAANKKALKQMIERW